MEYSLNAFIMRDQLRYLVINSITNQIKRILLRELNRQIAFKCANIIRIGSRLTWGSIRK